MVFATPYISPGQKYALEKGHTYSVWLPSSNLTNLPAGIGQAYNNSSFGIKYRSLGNIVYGVLEQGVVFIFSGQDVEFLTVPDSSSSYFYVLPDVRVQLSVPRNELTAGTDNFVGAVAAGTALTKRPAISIPFVNRVECEFMLSVQGAPGTVGDLYYIQVSNSGSKSQPACTYGSMSGVFDISNMNNQSVWIQYQNADTVAHAMSAAITVRVRE